MGGVLHFSNQFSLCLGTEISMHCGLDLEELLDHLFEIL